MRSTHFTRLRFVVAVLATAGAASTGLADTVTLRNGDRITGSVIRKEAATLIFKTPYAGEIKITWADVATLQTDQPVEIQLADGSHFAARLAADKAGMASIADPPPAREGSLRLERIAFLNPTPEQSGKGVAYQRRVNLAANLVRGNTDSSRLVGEGEFVARAKMYRYRLWGQGTWAEEGDATTESNWRTTGNYDWFVRPREFFYGRVSFEQDEFRDIKLRSQLGGGYGYQLIETVDAELSVQAGPNFVRAIAYDGPDESFIAAGWGIHHAQWLWTRRAQVYFDQSGFWNLQTTSDIVINTDTGVRIPLSGGLNATTSLKVDWDNDPAPGTQSTDTTVLLGVGYAW
jgi:putative salt-induced outer membrane protein YdiY